MAISDSLQRENVVYDINNKDKEKDYSNLIISFDREYSRKFPKINEFQACFVFKEK